MLKIRILTENQVWQRDLLAEHGLSLWIEDGPEHVLFDVGQTDVYLRNARTLGIDLAQTRAIVLSHGHYDHGGGLPWFPHGDEWPRVFVHPDALLPKSARSGNPGTPDRAIGFPWEKGSLEFLENRLMLNTATMQVGQRLFACAGIPRTTDFEPPADNLLAGQDGQVSIDDMHDEQMLIWQGERGLAVVLGCSHPGVVSCLNYAQKLFPGQPVHTVVGGMHLDKAGDDRVHQTIEHFRQLQIASIFPLHCTGQNAVWQMKQSLGDRVQIRCTGEEILIE